MRFRSPFAIRFLLQLLGFGSLVVSLVIFLFFALEAYFDSKRDNELQKVGTQVSEVFRQNMANGIALLSSQVNALDLNRKPFLAQAQAIFNQNPAILSIEIRNQRGLRTLRARGSKDWLVREIIRRNCGFISFRRPDCFRVLIPDKLSSA